MQSALDALFEDLAPDRIDHSAVEPDHGLGALMSSRKAKLWDIYVERWRAKTKRADGRLLEAFMALFAEAYDRLQDKDRLSRSSLSGLRQSAWLCRSACDGSEWGSGPMSWNAKVHWTEGLFLRPHHLQQGDRYLENALESRTRHVTPYPWGFASLEIDRDLAQQSKFALRRASGIMPDGGLFDFPAECPPPAPITTPETAAGQLVWLTMPARADNFSRGQPRAGGKRRALSWWAPRR